MLAVDAVTVPLAITKPLAGALTVTEVWGVKVKPEPRFLLVPKAARTSPLESFPSTRSALRFGTLVAELTLKGG